MTETRSGKLTYCMFSRRRVKPAQINERRWKERNNETTIVAFVIVVHVPQINQDGRCQLTIDLNAVVYSRYTISRRLFDRQSLVALQALQKLDHSSIIVVGGGQRNVRMCSQKDLTQIQKRKTVGLCDDYFLKTSNTSRHNHTYESQPVSFILVAGNAVDG